MSATPIIPGRLYRVRYHKATWYVIAPHPCAAIVALIGDLA